MFDTNKFSCELCENAECKNVVCNTNANCGTNGLIDGLFCQNNNVFQNYKTFTCNNPGTTSSSCKNTITAQLQTTCLKNQICDQGQCKPVACSNNANCGTETTVGGLFCGTGANSANVFQKYNIPTCTNPGQVNSSCTSVQEDRLQTTCANGCYQNGVCIPDLDGQAGVAPNPALTEQTVTFFVNATGGTGTYTYSWTGSCTGSNSSCYTSYQAPGTYSANLTLTSGTKSKTFIVYVIVNQACTSHASQACSGNSVYWYDSCGNKQEVAQTCTANQLCENAECKNVVCNTNANCGTNGLIDGLFCQNNNVFQNYKTFTCNNPGTTSSSCTNTITAQLQTTCIKNQICDQGQCKPVACSNNANCGTETTVGGLFCGTGANSANVFQKYNIPTCTNPGQVNSSCTSVQEDRLQTTCANGCYQNGVCIPDLDGQAGVAPNPALTEQTVTFFVNATGGTGTYTYSWTGSCTGSNSSCYTSYQAPGTYSANLTLTSGTKSKTFIVYVIVNQACTSHASQACSGNSVYWYDSCGNKQEVAQTCTANQLCENAECKNVVCNTNANCGTNGLIDGLFCQNNNVFQNYKTFTCNNPGTTSSSCKNTITAQLQTTCLKNQICDQGQCKPVACSNNANCGTETTVGGLFCGTGANSANVFQKYNIPTCTNPGQVNSSCTSVQEDRLQTTCQANQMCGNGQCLTELSVTASANPNPGQTNQTISFISNISGGTGTYTYNWTGACTGTNSICTTTFADLGTYTVDLAVSSGSQNKIAHASVVINPNCSPHALRKCVGDSLYWFDSCNIQQDLSQDCVATGDICYNSQCVEGLNVLVTASPNPVNTGAVMTFVSSVSGGTGIYSYNWTGACLGSDSICVTSFSEPGTYTANLAVTSGNQIKNGYGSVIANQDCVLNIIQRCDGNTVYNYDSCGNRGNIVQSCSANQLCENAQCKNINCSINSQCGQDGFVDDLTCGQDGNVHQQYQIFTCNLPGTINSNCTSRLEDRVKQTCLSPSVCQNGSCITPNIRCINNSECGADADTDGLFCQNGNVYQNHIAYVCNNPGQAISSCSNSISSVLKQTCTPLTQTCSNGSCQNIIINCSVDSQCGTNAYVNEPFCQNGNVWQNYKTYTCNNPGTATSNCSDSTVPEQKTVCIAGQICTSGACTTVTPNLTASASASPNPATTTQQVTFTPTVSGGNGTYSYIWTGDCVGINQTCQKTFSQPGNYVAILNVTSGTQSTVTSANVTVVTSVTSPSVQTNSATHIQLNSATLNGNITSLGGDTSANVWFQWGTSISYGYETSHQTLGSLTSFTHSAVGLATNTTYPYRAVIQNSNSTAYGQDIVFTTTAQIVNSAPTANAGPDQYVNPGQSTNLQGSGSDVNGQAVTYSWTCSGGYLSNSNIAQPTFVAPNVNFGANYNCTLTVRNTAGLIATDDMIVRINYVNNNIISNSVQTNSATNITTNSASLNGYLYSTNTNNTFDTTFGVWFQYGTSISYGSETLHQTMSYAGSFSQNVANLQPNTLYNFRAVAQDSSGQISYGQNMTFQTTGRQSTITVIKTVRNLSSGTNWANSVSAKPGDVLSFMIVSSITGSTQNLNNVTVRDILPANLINRTNVIIDNVVNYGDLNSGINIGYLSPSQMRTITYQVQVAPSSNFNFGNTTLTNYVTVFSTDVTGAQASASATVIVNKATVAGATSVSTGLTNNIWLDSFFLPALLAIMGVWGYKSGIFGIDEWIARRKTKTKDFRASKKLNAKIEEIKNAEVNTQKSSWPTL